jgi:curved DNA-binding protein CbpA
LGVADNASAAEIKDRYRELAKQHHPDVQSTSTQTTDFADVSAAYESLRDPARRAAVDEALATMPEQLAEEAEKLAHAAVALAQAGRAAEGLRVFLSAAPLLGRADPDADDTARGQTAAGLASRLLEVCDALGEPHYEQTAAVWTWLQDLDAVDSRAANAFFGIALRGGHHKLAMQVVRVAEKQGLEQGAAMRSTVRQVRQYRAKLKRQS